MIAVNLVPIEMRKLEQTPLPRRLVIFSTAGVCSAMLMVLLALHINTIPAVRASIETLNSETQALRALKYDQTYKALTAEQADFQTRKVTIATIKEAQIDWAEKLDQLWDLLPPTIWFDSVELREPAVKLVRGRVDTSEPGRSLLVITGYTAGSNISEISRFIAALREPGEGGSPAFIDDFVRIRDTKFEKETRRFKDLSASRAAIKFTVVLELKTSAEVLIEAAATPQPAAPKAAPGRQVASSERNRG